MSKNCPLSLPNPGPAEARSIIFKLQGGRSHAKVGQSAVPGPEGAKSAPRKCHLEMSGAGGGPVRGIARAKADREGARVNGGTRIGNATRRGWASWSVELQVLVQRATPRIYRQNNKSWEVYRLCSWGKGYCRLSSPQGGRIVVQAPSFEQGPGSLGLVFLMLHGER